MNGQTNKDTAVLIVLEIKSQCFNTEKPDEPEKTTSTTESNDKTTTESFEKTTTESFEKTTTESFEKTTAESSNVDYSF